MPESTWTGSLHETFRLLERPSRHLKPFLEADGLTPEELLGKLPYDAARAGTKATGGTPDPKRYRDGKQVYQTVGLLYEGGDGRIHVTELGKATQRWLNIITVKNSVILAKHAAYALSACQLRSPTGFGQKFDSSIIVFPFQFIWRAMLALDNKISSDELNRSLLKVRNEAELDDAIARVKKSRSANDVTVLGSEVIKGESKNDRIIPWMSLASFGWTLFPDKRGGTQDGTYYQLDPRTLNIVREAAQIRHRHRDFGSTEEYVEYISHSACLPRDVR